MHIIYFCLKYYSTKTFLNIIYEIDFSRTNNLREFALLKCVWNLIETF